MQIRKRREECVGLGNIATGESNYILGLLLQYLGQLHAAAEHMRLALAIYEKQLGVDHRCGREDAWRSAAHALACNAEMSSAPVRVRAAGRRRMSPRRWRPSAPAPTVPKGPELGRGRAMAARGAWLQSA